MQTFEGESVYVRQGKHKRTERIKWNGSIKPKGKKTARCYLNLNMNKKTFTVDVDIEMTKDLKFNVNGTMTDTKGRTQEINLHGVNPQDSGSIQQMLHSLY